MRTIGDIMLNSEYLKKVHYLMEGYVEVFEADTGKRAFAFGGFSSPVLEYSDGRVVSVSSEEFDFGKGFMLGKAYNKTGVPVLIINRITQADVDKGIVDLDLLAPLEEEIVKRSSVAHSFDAELCKLYGRIIEGIASDGRDIHDLILRAPVSQEGFNSLYEFGKILWDKGLLSKYEIALFDDKDRLFWCVRPDHWNFDKNVFKNCFLKVAAEEYDAVHNVNFKNNVLGTGFLNRQQAMWNDVFVQNKGTIKNYSVDELLVNAEKKAKQVCNNRIADITKNQDVPHF